MTLKIFTFKGTNVLAKQSARGSRLVCHQSTTGLPTLPLLLTAIIHHLWSSSLLTHNTSGVALLPSLLYHIFQPSFISLHSLCSLFIPVIPLMDHFCSFQYTILHYNSHYLNYQYCTYHIFVTDYQACSNYLLFTFLLLVVCIPYSINIFLPHIHVK